MSENQPKGNGQGRVGLVICKVCKIEVPIGKRKEHVQTVHKEELGDKKFKLAEWFELKITPKAPKAPKTPKAVAEPKTPKAPSKKVTAPTTA